MLELLFKNTGGKLYIKKRSFNEWLIWVIMIFPFVSSFLIDVLRFPGFIRFLLDLILVYFLIVFITSKYLAIKRILKPLVTLVAVFLLYTAIVYCFNFQSPFYYLWGVRNNFRFYVAFFAFAIYMSEDFVNRMFKLLDILFWINAVISLVQFFFMGVSHDFLGGLFGITGVIKANAYTLLFFIIVVGKSFLSALNGDEKIGKCIFKSVVSLVIAAMAEMKFYYVVFILILVISFSLTSFSYKKLTLLLISVAAVLIGATLLNYLFDSVENFLSFENVFELATKDNYSSEEDINRMSAVVSLSKNYVTETLQRLFGMGLGNADTSDLKIFNSTFYQNYSFLHYTWFMIAMLFLETGFVGIAIYIMFFVLCFRHARKQLKAKEGNRLFCQMGIMLSIFCVLLIFYNSSLRIEAGFLAYFVLALPFVQTESGKTEESA